MKKIFIVAITLLALNSCNDSTGALETKKQVETQRIICKETTVAGGYGYQIIEVDSIEYLTTLHGGIYPLIKKWFFKWRYFSYRKIKNGPLAQLDRETVF